MSEIIELDEHSEIETTLPPDEYEALRNEFRSKVDIVETGHGRYLLKSKQYVGNIVLPSHTIVVRPKIHNLNFFLMLAYAYELMELRENEFLYPRDREVFDVLLGVFLNKIEKLVKRGISKGYDEREACLHRIRGRVLVMQDLRRNPFLHHKVNCGYSEFDVDTAENQILKSALFMACRMRLQDAQLNRVARKMFGYFDPVSLIAAGPRQMPTVFYSRLNQHYEPLVNLARLVLENSSLNFQKTGEFAFSSFLVDMNLLFQKFLVCYLRQELKDYSVRGASRLGGPYSLTETDEWLRNPDIVIKRGGRPLLVMDAKYKILREFETDIRDRDVDQVFSYTFAVQVPIGILVYPRCEGSSIENSEPKRIKGTDKRVGVWVLDLTRTTREAFHEECSKFAGNVRSMLQTMTFL